MVNAIRGPASQKEDMIILITGLFEDAKGGHRVVIMP
jgi:hypothetical protein